MESTVSASIVQFCMINMNLISVRKDYIWKQLLDRNNPLDQRTLRKMDEELFYLTYQQSIWKMILDKQHIFTDQKAMLDNAIEVVNALYNQVWNRKANYVTVGRNFTLGMNDVIQMRAKALACVLSQLVALADSQD